MPVIEINGLTKDYGDHRGIFGLSFTVEEGEVFGYLGPNGCRENNYHKASYGVFKSGQGDRPGYLAWTAGSKGLK